MKLIFSFFLFFNLLDANVIRVDESVIDKENHLQWMNNSDITKAQIIWKRAKSYCETSHFLGYDNWHLPSNSEMQTLVKIYNDKKVLKNLDESVYWSKEIDLEEFGTNAYEVYIGNGHISSADKCDKERFICVRRYK